MLTSSFKIVSLSFGRSLRISSQKYSCPCTRIIVVIDWNHHFHWVTDQNMLFDGTPQPIQLSYVFLFSWIEKPARFNLWVTFLFEGFYMFCCGCMSSHSAERAYLSIYESPYPSMQRHRLCGRDHCVNGQHAGCYIRGEQSKSHFVARHRRNHLWWMSCLT